MFWDGLRCDDGFSLHLYGERKGLQHDGVADGGALYDELHAGGWADPGFAGGISAIAGEFSQRIASGD